MTWTSITWKEVEHLMMVIMLDEDHTHYSDAFGNIFEEDTLRKKQFLDGPKEVTMSKGGAAHAIVCYFCLYTCSNNDYVYCHLAATHLNIQWGCGECYNFMMGYVSKVHEHIQLHVKKSAKEQSQSSHKKDEGEVLGSPSDEKVSSNEEHSGEAPPPEEDDRDWSGSVLESGYWVAIKDELNLCKDPKWNFLPRKNFVEDGSSLIMKYHIFQIS